MTGPAVDPPASRFRVRGREQLAIHRWETDGVVHDGASNDTFHLSADGVRIVLALVERGPGDLADLAAATGLQPSRIQSVIADLTPLGLIQAC